MNSLVILLPVPLRPLYLYPINRPSFYLPSLSSRKKGTHTEHSPNGGCRLYMIKTYALSWLVALPPLREREAQPPESA